MLGGNGERVEEDQEDYEPVEDVGLNCRAALPSAESVPPAPVAAGKGQGGKGGVGWEIQTSSQPKAHKVPSHLSLAWFYCTTWWWSGQTWTKLSVQLSMWPWVYLSSISKLQLEIRTGTISQDSCKHA